MPNTEINLINKLDLKRCPHCNVALPHLVRVWGPHESKSHSGGNRRFWSSYNCQTCGGVILAASYNAQDGRVREIYPQPTAISESIPERANAYLLQAIESIHAPTGAVILAASAVDSMLKNKNYKDGNLFSRIDKAAKDHLITEEMAKWAHEVRLDANEQRHADEESPLPTETDAKKAINFALALAEFLFVLPARVEKGRKTE